MMTIASSSSPTPPAPPPPPPPPPPPRNDTAPTAPLPPEVPLRPPSSRIGAEAGGGLRRRVLAAAASSSSTTTEMSPRASSSSSSPPSTSTGGGSSSSSVLDRQLHLILLLRCLRNSNLSAPVAVPFLSSADLGVGLSPAEILWLGSAYSLFTVVAEMPSGYLSDVWGRRRTLKAAFACLSASLAVVSLARAGRTAEGASMSGVWSLLGSGWYRKWSLLLLSQLLRAIGSALFSGTDMALLFETLKRHGGDQQGKRSTKEDDGDGGEKDGGSGEAEPDADAGGEGEGDSRSKRNDVVKERVLAIESRHVFSSAVAEASSSALGGMLAASWALGLRGTVLASAVPFGVGAALCGMLEDDCPRRRRKREESAAAAAVAGEKEAGDSSSASSSRTTAAPPPTQRESALRQLRRASSSLLPGPPGSPLRAVFPVGVAINCATYVSATALLPLLYSGAGLPTSSFGWIGAANRAVSAGSSLSAPVLKRWMTPAIRGPGGGGEEDAKDRATGRSLTALAALSAMSFGIMSLSASLVPEDGSSTTAGAAFARAALPGALAVLSSLLLSAVRGLAWPLLGAAINGSVSDDSLRATALSLFAGSIKAGMVATGFVLGMVLEAEEVAHHHDKVDGTSVGAVPGLRDACMLCGGSLTVLAALSGGMMGNWARWFPWRRKRANALAGDGDDSRKED